MTIPQLLVLLEIVSLEVVYHYSSFSLLVDLSTFVSIFLAHLVFITAFVST